MNRLSDQLFAGTRFPLDKHWCVAFGHHCDHAFELHNRGTGPDYQPFNLTVDFDIRNSLPVRQLGLSNIIQIPNFGVSCKQGSPNNKNAWVVRIHHLVAEMRAEGSNLVFATNQSKS